MNLLVVSWRCIENAEAGGEEKYLYENLRRFGEDPDDEVVYLCSGGAGLPAAEVIGNIHYRRTGGKYTFFLLAALAYLRLAREYDFDVVVENITGVPFFTPLYVREPIVGIEHHLTGRVFFEELPFPLSLVGWALERSIPYVYADVPFLTVSPSSRRELEAFGLDVRGVVFNGVDEEFRSMSASNVPESPYFLYLGRIKRHKRLDELADVLERVRRDRPVELHIAGDGDYLDELERVVAERGLSEHVVFHGFVSRERKAELLEGAAAYVTPTRREGWCISVLEANARGTPAVGYDVPGLEDSIVHGETGFRCEESVDALAAKVSLLFDDEERRREMARRSVEWSRSFSWRDSAGLFRDAIEESAPSSGGTPATDTADAHDGATPLANGGFEGTCSVVIPAFNEADTLATSIDRIVRAVRPLFASYEVFVVDDGSDDGTESRLRKLTAQRSDLEYISYPDNRGKGFALKRGFRETSGEYVLFVDADTDLRPARMRRFVETLDRVPADIVIGSKRHPESVVEYPLVRTLLSKAYSVCIALLFDVTVRDTQVGMKLFRREVLERVLPLVLVKEYAFDIEILALARERGYDIAEAPVDLEYDFGGTSDVDWRAIARIGWDTAAVFYRQRLLGYYADRERDLNRIGDGVRSDSEAPDE